MTSGFEVGWLTSGFEVGWLTSGFEVGWLTSGFEVGWLTSGFEVGWLTSGFEAVIKIRLKGSTCPSVFLCIKLGVFFYSFIMGSGFFGKILVKVS